MASIPDPFNVPVDFDGRVRIFPLPNLVMFPNVIQPLHIFEPRYCQMFEDALDSDGLIAMSLLKPGWEQEYEERPAIEPIVCLSRIAAYAQQEDGRYNVFVQGVRRARVKRELTTDRLYRQANVHLLTDIYRSEEAARRVELQRGLLAMMRRLAPGSSNMHEQFEQAAGRPAQLGLLTDVIAFTMEFDIGTKQELLNELDVDRRAAHLFDLLSQREALTRRPFPPEFSDN